MASSPDNLGNEDLAQNVNVAGSAPANPPSEEKEEESSKKKQQNYPAGAGSTVDILQTLALGSFKKNLQQMDSEASEHIQNIQQLQQTHSQQVKGTYVAYQGKSFLPDGPQTQQQAQAQPQPQQTVQPRPQQQAQPQLLQQGAQLKQANSIVAATEKIKSPILRQVIFSALKQVTPIKSSAYLQIDNGIHQAKQDRKKETEEMKVKAKAALEKMNDKMTKKAEKGMEKASKLSEKISAKTESVSETVKGMMKPKMR